MSRSSTGRSLHRERIEGLPTVIFQLIQLYLSGKEYRQLVSSRKETFSSIRYETVNYSLRINAFAEEEVLKRIINSVKDKSKQISVRVRGDESI
jgi:spore coat polysaccharide biosynthesis protein SpsF (cytidylyltransferase family)